MKPNPRQNTISFQLSYIGSGAQNHVFGKGEWVIKVPRRSLWRALVRLIIPRRWLRRVERDLQGVVLPFYFLRAARFRAPVLKARWFSAVEVPNKERHYQPRHALATVYLEREDFFDAHFYRATPAEAVGLMEAFFETLEELNKKGYFLVDFIMQNFAFLRGRLVVVDPEMIVPLSKFQGFKGINLTITARCFARFLARDFHHLLRLKAEQTEDLGVRRALLSLGEQFHSRLEQLRQPGAQMISSAGGVGLSVAEEVI